MTTPQTFLGIPVDGDIVRAERRTEQRPLEEFSPLVQAVLDDTHVTEFGWRQYTPYFNDGDPCVFSAYGTWVRTAADEDADPDDLSIDYGHSTLTEDGETADTYARCKALAKAVDSGAFDDVLLEAFGDHAEVTVRRDGIAVGFYEHD